MNLGEIRDMKTNVKNKAKKQIDELVEKLKTNDFLKNPKIQNLIERVQKAQTSLESLGAAAETEGRHISQNLLDLIKTSDVASKIASRVLTKAEKLGRKLKITQPKKKRTTKKASSAQGVTKTRKKK